MHKKIGLLLGTIFLGVGILLAVVGAIVYMAVNHNRRQILADGVPVTATIVDITRRYIDDDARRTAYISYEVDGVAVTVPLRFWNSGMRVGQPVDIIVSRQNPRQFITTGVMHLIAVFILLGLAVIFGSIGAGFLLYELHKKRKFQWLLEYGTPVWANVLGIDENWNIQVNGRPAMVIVASYGNMQFTSRAVDNNDLVNLGEHVKILLDPGNYNRYMFDLQNECFREPLEPPKPLNNPQ